MGFVLPLDQDRAERSGTIYTGLLPSVICHIRPRGLFLRPAQEIEPARMVDLPIHRVL